MASAVTIAPVVPSSNVRRAAAESHSAEGLRPDACIRRMHCRLTRSETQAETRLLDIAARLDDGAQRCPRKQEDGDAVGNQLQNHQPLRGGLALRRSVLDERTCGDQQHLQRQPAEHQRVR